MRMEMRGEINRDGGRNRAGRRNRDGGRNMDAQEVSKSCNAGKNVSILPIHRGSNFLFPAVAICA